MPVPVTSIVTSRPAQRPYPFFPCNRGMRITTLFSFRKTGGGVERWQSSKEARQPAIAGAVLAGGDYRRLRFLLRRVPGEDEEDRYLEKTTLAQVWEFARPRRQGVFPRSPGSSPFANAAVKNTYEHQMCL